ncbi:MAG: amidohydrolase family protein [Gemmatimonadaceae bacterium]|nr:amidohydrolase family protein [Gemmatimonadaceae bacterium]
MIDRVYVARWVLPIATAPIARGAVAIEDGRIVWVGPVQEAPPGPRIDLGDCALTPGLVNVHAHLELTPMRGWLEDLPFRQWILRLTKTREATMTEARRLAAARVGLAEGLLAGITTWADVSDSGVSLDAMVSMGVRGIVFREVFGPDPAQCPSAIGALRTQVESMRARSTDLVSVGVSPHAPYTVSDALFRATASLALDDGYPLTVHVAEGAAEDALVRAGSGEFAEAWRARGIAVSPRARSPIALLHDTGILVTRPLLVHAVRADAADVALVRDSGSRVAHCPASNAKLGHGIAPLLELRAAGVPVGLGSDSVASSNRVDLLDEARVAAFQQRVRLGRPDALSAGEALRMATLGGAESLGMGQAIGALVPGLAADLVAFPLDGVGDVPVHAPEPALVFGAAGRRARFVTVAGRELVRDGALLADIRADVAVVHEAALALAEPVLAASAVR